MILDLVRRWAVLLWATTAVVVAEAGDAGTRTDEARTTAHSSTPSDAVEAIDQFCGGLVPMTKEKKRRQLFGLFDERGHGKGHWVEFTRESDLDAAIEEEHVYDIAQVWSRDDGATAIWMRLSSGSGDWFHFVEYCFRPDGTLARVQSTLNTFNAVDRDPEKEVDGATRKRDRYFDAAGMQIKVSRRILDLKTKRPAPTLQVMDDREPIYKKTTALPFYGLLKAQHRAAQPGVERSVACGARPRVNAIALTDTF